MELAVSFDTAQISAANELHGSLDQWRVSDAALQKLHHDYPGFELEEVCVLKCVALNSLYATRVYAIVRVAQKIHKDREALVEPRNEDEVCEIVKRIAEIDREENTRRLISFAAKFCHFFISDRIFTMRRQKARSNII